MFTNCRVFILVVDFIILVLLGGYNLYFCFKEDKSENFIFTLIEKKDPIILIPWLNFICYFFVLILNCCSVKRNCCSGMQVAKIANLIIFMFFVVVATKKMVQYKKDYEYYYPYIGVVLLCFLLSMVIECCDTTEKKPAQVEDVYYVEKTTVSKILIPENE